MNGAGLGSARATMTTDTSTSRRLWGLGKLSSWYAFVLRPKVDYNNPKNAHSLHYNAKFSIAHLWHLLFTIKVL